MTVLVAATSADTHTTVVRADKQVGGDSLERR